MTAIQTGADDHTQVGRYLLGFGILALTVVFSNIPQLIQHPERFLDVARPTSLALRLQALGYVLQMAVGTWLSLSLIFEIAPARRVAVFLWPCALALYLAPLPDVREDLALAPALLAGAAALAALSFALDRATRHTA
jgi:hypothetical protein